MIGWCSHHPSASAQIQVRKTGFISFPFLRFPGSCFCRVRVGALRQPGPGSGGLSHKPGVLLPGRAPASRPKAPLGSAWSLVRKPAGPTLEDGQERGASCAPRCAGGSASVIPGEQGTAALVRRPGQAEAGNPGRRWRGGLSPWPLALGWETQQWVQRLHRARACGGVAPAGWLLIALGWLLA